MQIILTFTISTNKKSGTVVVYARDEYTDKDGVPLGTLLNLAKSNRKVNCAFNTYIEFEPSIYNYENSPEQITGVRIFLGSDGISFFMNLNTLFAFKYFIDTFNMYQSAQNMLTYLGRPENGTNYTGYEQNYKQYQESQSFFNRVNAERKND